MLRNAKELVKAKGILHIPNPKLDKMQQYDTVKLVNKFYDDKISRCMPGKDFFICKRTQNILVGRPEGRPLGRPRRRWEDNIKMDLWEIGFGMWIGFIGLRIGTGGGLL
jgi:hypothetical protein